MREKHCVCMRARGSGTSGFSDGQNDSDVNDDDVDDDDVDVDDVDDDVVDDVEVNDNVDTVFVSRESNTDCEYDEPYLSIGIVVVIRGLLPTGGFRAYCF